MMAGRPTKFNKSFCQLAENYAKLGAIDTDLANFFGVTESTIYLWKKEYPEFSEALKRGKATVDAQVKKSLFQRATGYAHPEERTFVIDGIVETHEVTKHHPPDTTACIFWLKNRDPENWRDKVDLEHGSNEQKPLKINVTYRDSSKPGTPK